MKTSFTKEQLQVAIQTSNSIRGVLIKLNLAPAGGGYQTVKKYVKLFNLDTSHFKGMAWRKGFTFKPKRSLDEYLSNEFPIQSFKLKRRLLKENIFPHKCFNCEQEKWLSKPIPLELHHIDGNNQNNNLNNLQLMCPNCHALTDTYRGKNIGGA